MTAIILSITLGYTAAILYVAWCLINMRADLDRKTDELAKERLKLREVEEEIIRTELRVQDYVVKTAPLIAKTDWMTGRWGGQFNTLVNLENQRNRDVEAARKALYELPLVKREARRNPYGFAQPIQVQPYTPKDIDK